MKTLVLGFFFLGLTSLTYSQNDLAVVEVRATDFHYAKPSKSKLINANYYTSFDTKISSARIRNFQNVVANYNVKTSAVYSTSEQSQYTIVFEEGQNKIEAQYDQNGTIVNCNEVYKDIKLPYVISSDIAKTYPDWEFAAVWCHVNYSVDKPQQVIYKVMLQQGSKKKTVKIDAASYNL